MKRFVSITISSVFILCGLLQGCGKIIVPSDVMNEKTMVSFLKDAYTLEGFYAIETSFHYDSLYPQMRASYDSLLASYDISREDFERSIDWYSHHPEVFEKVHQSVIAEIDTAIAHL